MSFLIGLVKGFIRSAVNQVGRDGGRVISNKVYKSQHSVPVRDTSSSYISDSNYIKEEGLRRVFFENGLFMQLAMLIGSFALPILGSLYWFFASIKYFSQKTTNYYKLTSVGVYKQDRRYKHGQKLIGHETKETASDFKTVATTFERRIYLLKGVVALFLATSSAIMWYYIFTKPSEEPKGNVEINFSVDTSGKFAISENSTFFLFESPNPNKSTNNLIYKGDTVFLIDTDTTKLLSDTIWYKAESKGDTGWFFNIQEQVKGGK